MTVWLYEDVSNHHSKMENIERIEAKKHIIANLDREEGSAGVTTYRKYLSWGQFLSSPINKVYLVDIIPVCLCIIWTHYMNTLHCLYIVWTHVRPPCYMNTCTDSLLYEHIYGLLVIWTHASLLYEHMYDLLSISVVVFMPNVFSLQVWSYP